MSVLPGDVNAWLEKAHNDFRSAKALIEQVKPPILDTGCFHCQQCAEKALKAFLIWKDIHFEKSHNLVYLLDLCGSSDEAFGALLPEAQVLTPYAIETRYPGEVIMPPMDEGRLALDSANKIWQFVLSHIPLEHHPSPIKSE